MDRVPFTLERADALLPELRETLVRLRELQERARAVGDKLAILDAIWGERAADPAVPDHAEFVDLTAALRKQGEHLKRVVQADLLDRGVRLPPGGIEHGLLDFPTTLDGRWIFLCWQEDEETIEFWHEVEGGFAGRQALTAAQAERLGQPVS